MAGEIKNGGRGIGFGSLLFLLFLGLKLTGHIDWSWWWITAPLWGPFAFIFAVAGIMGAVCCIVLAFVKVIEKVCK